MAFDAAGNALAVWEQADNARYDIWSNRYVAGLGWGTPTLVETNDSASASSVRLAVGANGNAVAVWLQGTGSATSVWANHYTVGAGWGTAAPIDPDQTGDATLGVVVVDASGNALATWTQRDGTRDDIRVGRFD